VACLNDSIRYNCSFHTNSISLTLSWTVTLPGQQPLTFSYRSTFGLGSNQSLRSGVVSTLTGYRERQYIESILTLEVQITRGANVMCTVSDLPAVETYVPSNSYQGTYVCQLIHSHIALYAGGSCPIVQLYSHLFDHYQKTELFVCLTTKLKMNLWDIPMSAHTFCDFISCQQSTVYCQTSLSFSCK
jgi:hypothetical protein